MIRIHRKHRKQESAAPALISFHLNYRLLVPTPQTMHGIRSYSFGCDVHVCIDASMLVVCHYMGQCNRYRQFGGEFLF